MRTESQMRPGTALRDNQEDLLLSLPVSCFKIRIALRLSSAMLPHTMDQTLKKICELLKNTDNMKRCGAAVVLAELAPSNKQVVEALGQALPESGQQLSGYILDALQAIGSPAAVPFVMPLIRSDDVAVRMRAVAIVAMAGTAVVPEIKRQLKEATRQQKLIFIDLLARIHASETLDMLLEQLFDPDFGLVKETCDAIRRHAKDADPAARLKLHKQVVKFMNSQKVREQERVMTSSLLLLGHIGRPEAAAIILKHNSPKTVPYIRRHALIALKSLDYTGSAGKTVLAKILPNLDEADEEIVRHTLDIIYRLPSPDITAAQWRSLLKNQHASARAFAARKLAETDTSDNNLLLIDLLRHEDNDIREIASSALAGHKSATPLLLKALTSETDLEASWRLARILKPHGATIDKKALARLTELASKELLAGKPRYEPLLYLVRNIDPKAAESVLLEAGTEHKRAKRWAAAVDCLRRLLHTETFTDDVSYALSVCDLKVSKKELAPQFRAEDHSLRGFTSLFRRNSADLLARIRKDKSLDAIDLYYVGFHFNEGPGDEKTFGEEVLKHVARTWPKSEEAKNIKTRIRIENLPEPKPAAKKKSRR